jgi:hypothetical protein
MTAAITYTARVEESTIRSDARGFGITDKYGREIGVLRTIVRVVYEVSSDPKRNCCSDPAGTWFEVHVRQTRAGRCHGPLQHPRTFATLDEAEVYAINATEQRRKSYTKQFAA